MDYIWLPVVMALLFVGWKLLRYLAALWWLYFVFKPAINKWLDENLPLPRDPLGGEMKEYEVTRHGWKYITVKAVDEDDARVVAENEDDDEWEESPDYDETVELVGTKYPKREDSGAKTDPNDLHTA